MSKAYRRLEGSSSKWDADNYMGTTLYYTDPFFYVPFVDTNERFFCLAKINTSDHSNTVACSDQGTNDQWFVPNSAIFSESHDNYLALAATCEA